MDSFFSELTSFMELHSKVKINLPVQWVLLSNGGTDLNDNVIFFGFEGRCLEPSFVAKVPRLPSNGWILQIEYDRLTDLWHVLGEQAKTFVPEPLAFGEIRKQPVLIISYLLGTSLVNATRRDLWKHPTRVLELSIEAAHLLRQLNDKTTCLITNNEDVLSDLSPKIEKFKHLYFPSDAELYTLTKLEKAYRALPGQYKTLIQGDFWHGNLIHATKYNRLMLVDWQYSKWSKDVSLDVYLFLLAGALAATPDGSPRQRAEWTKNTLLDWRSKIIPAYLSAYGVVERFSLLPARYGMLVCCIEKAVRTVLSFGHNQWDDPIWRALFTELINIPDDSGFYDGI